MGLVEKGLEFIDKLTKHAGYVNEWIVLREEDTISDYGLLPFNRPIDKHIANGVINLDKPPGPTSHEVVAWIKKMFSIDKAGHGGTLDPKVTGVLPIGLANATRVIGNVVHSDKEYVMVIQLHGSVDENKLREVLSEFVGEIYQKPPLRSSVKRSIRRKKVYSIDLIESRDKYVLVKIHCEAGTYMRKIAHDLGLILGIGAHMRELRRVKTGPFREDETLIKMQDISEALYMWRVKNNEFLLRKIILPVETAIVHLPKIIIRDTAVDSIAHGADLAVPGIVRLTRDVSPGKTVAILTLKGELVALGKALNSSEEIKNMEKGIVVKTWRVYIDRGIYPSTWRKK